jgi:hypothetical protein
MWEVIKKLIEDNTKTKKELNSEVKTSDDAFNSNKKKEVK